tara:strand:+ start:22 stop:417 length:396 start_codon:yes stop_codon:yes gene_type:complete
MTQKEYKFVGLNMQSISILYGIFLILWGLAVNFVSSSSSYTSLIPSIMGLPILIFSLLAVMFPSKIKIMMHIVVLFGLLVALGGMDVFRSLVSGNFLNSFWADLSKLMMLLTGVFFTYLCILSFRFARRNK